ncbi:hypothetical protein BC628DRAFT_1353020 [Trametes gibbosa]|nr:hypothetical protein BC628DRAFT_1353020 [Trametes gibbosa]
MSNVSNASADFDFWEFVNCGVCHLEFVKESGALSSLPFWLSECGHVICNAHLNADQSCAACGTPGVQFMPLQKELEPPMANWFNSVPTSLDTVAYALRFQMDTMANLVRYFKKKYQQYRPLFERLKQEHAETKRLKKLVDSLKLENAELRHRLQTSGSDGADTLNANHKRMRQDDDGCYSGQRTSSPRSAATSLGPDRLTLPPGHHQPQFNSRQSLQLPSSAPVAKQALEHYAYVPPRSAQAATMAMPTLTHVQSGSTRRAQIRDEGNNDQSAIAMPPPPLPASRLEQRASMGPRIRMPPPTPQPGSGSKLLVERSSLLPPPTPQISFGGSQRFLPPASMKAPATALPPQPHVIIPGAQYAMQAQATQTQRFLPTGGNVRLPGMVSMSGSGSAAGSASVPQTPTRARVLAPSSSSIGRQRMAFVPGDGTGR